MHPAFSIVFFTAASGAGYGLLAWIGLAAGFGAEGNFAFRFVGLGLAMALIVAGLLSSTAHLGRPERAWRALSQWRSSWLSREAVAALATFVPAGFLALGWIVLDRHDGWVAASGLAAALGAVVTVSTTGMIYASMKTIAQWHSLFTLPSYLIFAAMTGSLLFNALLQLLGSPSPTMTAMAMALTVIGWLWKLATWRHNDTLTAGSSVNAATGLAGGEVRVLEWPHSEENYILKEMGFRIARKHRARLRRIAQASCFALPLALLGAALGLPAAAPALSLAAALLQLAGILIERWLFFAEATHSVMLYYRG
ncbi:MAG: dimethyl sulfoxide reductase anchor subunit family protein [Parvibaculaceae bacterium]